MENFNQEQFDALKEIGNIGGGNAATALSQLLSKRVVVHVPQIRLIPFNEIKSSDFFIKPEELSIAVSLRILGKLAGGIMVLYPHKSALLMIDILTNRAIGTTELFTVMDESALMESAHIICCSYLNAVGEFLGLYHLVPSITEVAMDKIDKLSQVMTRRFITENINYILPIENHLVIQDVELSLFVIFLLESESLKKILKIAGL
jgi:chemotaxis protein CheC